MLEQKIPKKPSFNSNKNKNQYVNVYLLNTLSEIKNKNTHFPPSFHANGSEKQPALNILFESVKTARCGLKTICCRLPSAQYVQTKLTKLHRPLEHLVESTNDNHRSQHFPRRSTAFFSN